MLCVLLAKHCNYTMAEKLHKNASVSHLQVQKPFLFKKYSCNISIEIERENFLNWISKVDFEKIHRNIYAKKHKYTGDWLIQEEKFKAWFSGSESSLLWCHGKRECHLTSCIMKHAYQN